MTDDTTKQEEQAVETEQEDSNAIPFPTSEVVGEPVETTGPPAGVQSPVQTTRPPIRHIVIETDGDRLTVRNTMGLLELRTCLQMLARQVDAEIDQKATQQPPAPASTPEPAEAPPEPEVAEE
jgi:hypothetical protein